MILEEYMRTYRILILIVVALLGQDSKSQKVDFHNLLPDSIKSINSVTTLGPYINNQKTDLRIFGVIRLGQIGKSEDITILQTAYDNESIREGIIFDVTAGVKYYALESIGQIGGALAESVLISIGNQLWGSETCTDSELIITALCNALNRINTTKSLDFLIQLYENKEFPWFSRTEALINAYSIELKKSVYLSEKDSIDYLLSMAPVSGPYGMDNRENCIIMTAIRTILLRESSCNANSINYLRQKTADNSINSELRTELDTIANQMQRRYEWLQNQN